MSDKLRESLSAAMDGEADEFELRRVLDEAVKDATLAASWERYHVMRNVFRGEMPAMGAVELRERIWTALVDIDTDEPVDEVIVPAAAPQGAVDGGRASLLLGRVTSIAVAAGAALAVVVLFNLSSEEGPTEPPQLAVQTATPRAPTTMDVRRAHAYMLHHAQQTALNGQSSVVPFTKVAAFETP